MMIKARYILLIVIGVIVSLGLIALTRHPVGIALLKSKRHFIKHPAEPRVYYEPGAEGYAEKIAAFLPEAIRMVEEGYYTQFKKSFKVYMCSSQKSHNEYLANRSLYPIRGSILRGDILIAPSAFYFNGEDTHKQSLMHELAHLLFFQNLGFFKSRNIPVWFGEGLGNYVSGTGDETFEDAEAIDAILSGRHFVPEEHGGIFKSFHKAFSGISPQMFQKQNKMFLKFIIERNPSGFKQFLLDLQAGKPFATSFHSNFNTSVSDVWEEFKTHIASQTSD